MSNCLGRVHPLLIREVASKLFEYLGRNELLGARFVCSQWKSIGWAELKRRIVINFRTTSALESYTEFFTTHSNSLSPFTSYQFTLQLPANYELTSPSGFFSKFGSKIQGLDLLHSNIVLTQELQGFLICLKHLAVNVSRISLPAIECPSSLHSLEFCCEDSSEKEELLEELLRRQNCLKVFKLNAAQNSPSFLEKLIGTISTSKSLKSLHIEKLDIQFPISVFKLTDFVQNRFQLKSVSILIDNRDKEISITETLYNFLKSQKNCLEKFECRFSRWWQPEFEFGKIPCLNYLKEIYLEFVAGDLQFLSDCRMLKKVKILSWRPILNLNQIENETFSIMPSVEVAVINLSGFPIVYDVLDYVTIIFPGLTTFQFNASVTGDTGIYSQLIKERLPQLTEKSVERLLPV